ncbi:MAG: hypothetical protein ABI771_14045 [Betaproteobacteria bacterium]
MEPAVIDLPKDAHTPMQDLNVINNLAPDACGRAIKTMNLTFVVFGSMGIQRVRVLP